MKEVGYAALLLSLVVSSYASVAFVVGRRKGYTELIESAERAVLAVAMLATLASGILLYLLLSRDFSVEYVFRHTSTYQSTLYTFSAFWAGQEGSLLLWLWVLSILAVIALLDRQGWNLSIQYYALAVLAGIEAVFSLLLVWLSNPFAPSPRFYTQGVGVNPLLENPGMIVHPPAVFIGYAGFSVPFAYAVAALVTKQLGEEWLHKVRSWTLFAWVFLGVGIILGGWWAYMELGWGGYWAWDPVENSSLIPWLTATAFLHSAVVQKRRRMFKNWTVVLILVTFVLCLFATFVTRSGFIQSVHAFARSPLGYFFLAILIPLMLGLAYLVISRREELKSSVELDSVLSKEASFYLSNLLFTAGAAVILLGTIFPTITEAITGREVQLGAGFFNRTFIPIAGVIFLIMGFCFTLAWGDTDYRKLLRWESFSLGAVAIGIPTLVLLGVRELYPLVGFSLTIFVGVSTLVEFYRGVAAAYRKGKSPLKEVLFFPFRRRRPYGGYLVHLGIVLIALGVLGSSLYKTEVMVSMKPGETVEVGGYTFKYLGYEHHQTPVKDRFTASMEVYRGDRLITTIRAEKNYHWNVDQWVTEIGLHSTFKEDIYLILAGLEENGLASFQILINPLVNLIWAGGGLLLLGGLLALWPYR